MPKPSARATKLCLLSHHPLVLEEFHQSLASSGFRIRMQRLESELAPDLRRLPVPSASIYVVDAYAPRRATEALVVDILDRFPKARLVLLTEKLSEHNSFPLLRLGAKGLLSYAEAREQLPRAVHAVASGGFWVPRSLLATFVDAVLRELRGRRPLSAPAGLSRREQEVLQALLENLSNKEIATRLHISERTAKFHVSNLLAKFGVQRRADLILLHFQSVPAS